MPRLFKKIMLPISLGTLSCVAPAAHASNGFYLTGYGMESFMMGGADVAVSRDAFAANNNPSGLTQIQGQSAEIDGTFFDNVTSAHTDSFGNYRKSVKGVYGVYGSGAYGQRIANTPYAVGVSLVVQGGIGWTYSGLEVNPALGGPHRDDASSLFTIIKLSPAFAWEVNDQLSLGVALGVNYLSASQELFPNTSTAGFSGFRFKGASGIGLTSKWGLQYRPYDDVTIGMTYGTKTSLPLKGGNLRINYTSTIPGEGVVRYDNAKLEGFHLPQELAVGIAFRPTKNLLVSLEDKWYDWSDAIKTLQLSASSPRSATAPASVVFPPASVDFRDQHVIEIGMAYDWNKDLLLMAGINHGSRPLPDQNLSPIFAAVQARHYMFGAKYQLHDGWYSAGGFEWYPLQSATYDSPIFGPRANERHYAYVFQFAVGRNW
jgi:long-chain fatty acid transport protein